MRLSDDLDAAVDVIDRDGQPAAEPPTVRALPPSVDAAAAEGVDKCVELLLFMAVAILPAASSTMVTMESVSLRVRCCGHLI